MSKSLALLEAIIADRDGCSITAIAAQIGLPKATAHRQVTTLLREGYLHRPPGGRFVAGPRLVALAGSIDSKQLVAAAAAPILHRLARKLRCVVQLGTLENDMVTYRIKTGHGAGDLFTRVGLQHEAYCTGIGKVLLANLTEGDRESYLAAGPFPALTRNTITDPTVLRAELEQIRTRGYARDNEEISVGLVCFAAPIRVEEHEVLAAISASRLSEAKRRIPDELFITAVLDAAREIGIVIQSASSY
ncbi:MAG: IclR family transcriptional regulator [Novosphingobium sp.]